MRVTKRAARGASQQTVEGGRTSGGMRRPLPAIVMAAVAVIGLTAAPAASAATSGTTSARPAKTIARPVATASPPAKAQAVNDQPAAPSVSERRRLAAAAVRHVLAHRPARLLR
jgi:hypothetical protein